MCSDAATVVEVGPRDGLQNEPALVPTDIKVELIKRLVASGLDVVEATSFVSPKWVPQMADAAQVMAALDFDAPVRYPVLVPNDIGYFRAREAGAREVAVFAAASETFSQKNTNCSISESVDRFGPIVSKARHDGCRVRGYISCVLGCPYEGEIDLAAVVDLSAQLAELGCEEISLGDTIGVGTPKKARQMVEAVATAVAMDRLAVHFHDTYGQALANIVACLESGVRTVDSSVAGLGGCPFAKGASGNVATEDVVYMLSGMGFETGIDLDRLAATGEWISDALKRTNHSRAGNAIRTKAGQS